MNPARAASPSLIGEIERALSRGSGAQRADVLHRVTDLFLHGAESYAHEHVTLFDDVMCHLVEQIERYALIRLSLQLAPVDKPPTRVIHRLAQDDDIAISGPVIEKSPGLSDEFLADIARTKSQAHLAAIAARSTVAEDVTDVLVERGNAEVTLKVTGNAGARFSKNAYFEIAKRAQDDIALAETMLVRPDVPADVFEHLLHKATEVVRYRLLRNADPKMRSRVTRTLAEISAQVAQQASRQADGHSAVTLPHKDPDRLREDVARYAGAGKRTQTVEALATLSKLPVTAVRSLMREGAQDGVLILCKAVGLGWPDVKQVLTVMIGEAGETTIDFKKEFEKYLGLSADSASRVLRFVKSCKAISKADLQRML